VRNDLERAEILARILAQRLAEKISNLVGIEALGLLPPQGRSAVLDGQRDRPRLRAALRAPFLVLEVVLRRVVVQYRLGFARAYVQPPVTRPEVRQRAIELGGQSRLVIREPSIHGVAARLALPGAPVDAVLFRHFLPERGSRGSRGSLGTGGFKPRSLYRKQ